MIKKLTKYYFKKSIFDLFRCRLILRIGFFVLTLSANLWSESVSLDKQTLVVTDTTKKDISKKPVNVKEFAEKYGLQGNWVTKKIYLIKAAQMRGEIGDLNEEIIKIRSDVYNPKIDQINDGLKSFKLSSGGKKSGITTGILQLQSRVDNNINDLLELEKKAEQENYSQDVRFKIYENEDKYAHLKDSLAKLKVDVDLVDDLQKRFEKRIAELDKNVTKASEFAILADEKVDEISFVLDHEKARKLAAYVEALLGNMRLILDYVKNGAISQFDAEQQALNKEVDRIKTELTKITTAVEGIETEILNLMKTSDATSQLSKVDSSTTTTGPVQASADKIKNLSSEKKGLIRSFFEKIFNFFKSFF